MNRRAAPSAAVFLLALASASRAADAPAVVRFSMQGGVPISPLLYGLNYDWDKVPKEELPAFLAAMARTAHETLIRYPGGWNAERYDWARNAEVGAKAPDRAGADPEAILAAGSAVSFITPSAEAVARAERIPDVAAASAALAARYGARVLYWEIGNEWWLQRGAKQRADVREKNRRNYAVLLSAAVPAMKAASPSIRIYATGDWRSPEDFKVLQEETSPAAWALLDGVSVHPYCGTTDPQSRCANLPAMLDAVRRATGKKNVYASEWAAVLHQNVDDFGMRNASLTVDALTLLAQAGVTLGAYWPPVKNVPALAFASGDYRRDFATGLAFGWMAANYRGLALPTSGDLTAAVARDGATVRAIVPAGDAGPRTVRLALTGTGLTRVVEAQVMFSQKPKDRERGRIAQIVPLPTRVVREGGETYAEFRLNPGTPGRGSALEIARVALR